MTPKKVRAGLENSLLIKYKSTRIRRTREHLMTKIALTLKFRQNLKPKKYICLLIRPNEETKCPPPKTYCRQLWATLWETTSTHPTQTQLLPEWQLLESWQDSIQLQFGISWRLRRSWWKMLTFKWYLISLSSPLRNLKNHHLSWRSWTTFWIHSTEASTIPCSRWVTS